MEFFRPLCFFFRLFSSFIVRPAKLGVLYVINVFNQMRTNENYKALTWTKIIKIPLQKRPHFPIRWTTRLVICSTEVFPNVYSLRRYIRRFHTSAISLTITIHSRQNIVVSWATTQARQLSSRFCPMPITVEQDCLSLITYRPQSLVRTSRIDKKCLSYNNKLWKKCLSYHFIHFDWPKTLYENSEIIIFSILHCFTLWTIIS